MQSLVGSVEKMGALLFVRCVDDVSCAARTVNELLVRRGTLDLTGDVLGILVREDVDLNLPVPRCGGASPANDDIAVRESVALSGIWSLCWFDLGLVDERNDAVERRRRLLDAFSSGSQTDRDKSAGRFVFFPVLTGAEVRHDVGELVDDLEARYPALAVGRDCFVHDPSRGGLIRLEEEDSPLAPARKDPC